MADKFKALVHYVCDRRSERPHSLEKTKLNKVAWLSDMLAYLRFGRPITNEVYIKRQFGPVARSMEETLQALKREGALASRGTEYFGYPKFEYMTLKHPDISGFTPEEISLIDEVIERICDGHTASSISQLTHDAIWECAGIGEELPLYTAFASVAGEITEDDLAWASTEVERLEL